MGNAYSYEENFHLKLVSSIQSNLVCNVEEILSTIQQIKQEIDEKIEMLENEIEDEDAADKAMAVLIRQNQYLDALMELPKYMLSELFMANQTQIEEDSNVLRWYKKD